MGICFSFHISTLHTYETGSIFSNFPHSVNIIIITRSHYLQEVHDYLKTVCPDLHITRGEYDEDSRYPDTKTLTIGQFKLGVCHGHQVYIIFSLVT